MHLSEIVLCNQILSLMVVSAYIVAVISVYAHNSSACCSLRALGFPYFLFWYSIESFSKVYKSKKGFLIMLPYFGYSLFQCRQTILYDVFFSKSTLFLLLLCINFFVNMFSQSLAYQGYFPVILAILTSPLFHTDRITPHLAVTKYAACVPCFFAPISTAITQILDHLFLAVSNRCQKLCHFLFVLWLHLVLLKIYRNKVIPL